MNIKQMAKNIISRDCGIVTAICFFLTLVALFANLFVQSLGIKFILFVAMLLVSAFGFYFYRVKFLINLLQVEYSFIRIFKLWRFVVAYVFAFLTLIFSEHLICYMFKLGLQMFLLMLVATGLIFFIVYFTYVSAVEIEYLTNGYNKDFSKTIFKKYTSLELARHTVCSVLQFACVMILFFGVLKTFSFYSLLVVVFGVYFICLFVFYLEQKKLYKGADVA